MVRFNFRQDFGGAIIFEFTVVCVDVLRLTRCWAKSSGIKSCAAPKGSMVQVSKSPQEACRTPSFI